MMANAVGQAAAGRRPLDKTMTATLDDEIKDLARWLELDLKLPR